jgi:RND family efflux transporter MFP subunit
MRLCMNCLLLRYHSSEIVIKKNKSLKNLVTTLLLFCSLLLFNSCGGTNDNDGERQFPGGGFGGGQATSVEVTPVQTGTISDQVRAFGSVKAQDVVMIAPQVTNRVTRIHADLGDEVTQGQLLAEINDVPFREALEQAQAQLRQARATFQRDSTQLSRQQELFERELISRSEYDDVRTTFLNSEAQYESAQSALAQAQEDLENTRIKSPVNGVVLNRFISVGDLASSGQEAFELANLIGYETRVFLPLQDWESVQIGQDVAMSLSTRGSDVARGVVSRKSPQLNTTTGLGEIVITLTDVGSNVYQGALMQTRINLETRENAVIIPRSAMVETVDTYIEPETGTIELDRNYSAFISQGDSVAVRRSLTLGIEQGDRIEILEGLEPGDGLIITGHSNLEDGSRIRVAGSDPSTLQQLDFESAEQRQNMTPEQRERMRERRGGGGDSAGSSNGNNDR